MNLRLVVLCAALAASQALAAPKLPVYEATYRVEYKGRNSGSSVFAVSYDAQHDRYTFRSETQVKGLLKLVSPNPVVEHSEFELSDGALRPLSFRYEDGSRKGEDNYTAEFDWASGEVAIQGENGLLTLALESGTLDRGSLQVMLMHELASDALPGPHVLADEDSLKTYEFAFEDDAVIDTPLGQFTAKRLRQQRVGSSRHTVLWMVPKLKFLPVLIEQYRDGEVRTAFALEELEWR
jgi:hypothetical protein